MAAAYEPLADANTIVLPSTLTGAGKQKRKDVLMAGTKQFDHDAVVERAMMLFWRKGYGGTSIHDLEKATRLRRGSLYNAFGDKQGLFVTALKRYETTVGQERIKQLSNPDPYKAIEGFLNTLVTQMSEPSRPRGCLHTNTSLEFPNAPDEVLRNIAERTAGIEGAIYVALRRGQAEGIFDPAADARDVDGPFDAGGSLGDDAQDLVRRVRELERRIGVQTAARPTRLAHLRD